MRTITEIDEVVVFMLGKLKKLISYVTKLEKKVVVTKLEKVIEILFSFNSLNTKFWETIFVELSA